MVGTLGKKVSDVVINIDGSATGAVAAIATTEGAMGGLGVTATATAATMASALAVATAGLSILLGAAVAIVTAAGSLTDKSEEQNKILQKTASILATTGISYSENAASIDRNVESLSNLSGITENEVLTSYNKLMTAQISVSDGFRLNKVAADLAYTADIDLAGASDIVKQAIMGKVDGLGDYGFVLDATATKTEIINDIFAQESGILADSSDAANSLTSQNLKLSESFGDIVERVGNAVTPIILDSVTALNEWGDSGGWEHVMGALKGIGVLGFGIYQGFNTVFQILQAVDKTIVMVMKDAVVAGEYLTGVIDVDEATLRLANNWAEYKEGISGDWNDFIQPAHYMQDIINETAKGIEDSGNIQVDSALEAAEAQRLLNEQLEIEHALVLSLIEDYGDLSIEKKRAAYNQALGRYTDAEGNTEGSFIGSTKTISGQQNLERYYVDLMNERDKRSTQIDEAVDISMDVTKETYRPSDLTITEQPSIISNKPALEVSVDNSTLEALMIETNRTLTAIMNNTGSKGMPASVAGAAQGV